MLRLSVLALIVLSAAPAVADRVVALVPLATLGAEDKSASTKKLTGQIEERRKLRNRRCAPSCPTAWSVISSRFPWKR